MKLYYAPGACSLADHIALLEVGATFETEAVDIRTKRTASGEDFLAINPKGYVPALVLDDCEILTENIAVLDWIAEQYPQLRRNGDAVAHAPAGDARVHLDRDPPRLQAAVARRHETRKSRRRARRSRACCNSPPRRCGRLSVRRRADRRRLLSLRHAALGREVRHRRAGRAAAPAVADGAASLRAGCAGARGSVRSPHASRSSSTRSTAEVRENPEQHRFERPIHDSAIAAAYYRDCGRQAGLHPHRSADGVFRAGHRNRTGARHVRAASSIGTQSRS